MPACSGYSAYQIVRLGNFEPTANPFDLLARAVYRINDERGRVKKEINALLNSEIGEEKPYTAY